MIGPPALPGRRLQQAGTPRPGLDPRLPNGAAPLCGDCRSRSQVGRELVGGEG